MSGTFLPPTGGTSQVMAGAPQGQGLCRAGRAPPTPTGGAGGVQPAQQARPPDPGAGRLDMGYHMSAQAPRVQEEPGMSGEGHGAGCAPRQQASHRASLHRRDNTHLRHDMQMRPEEVTGPSATLKPPGQSISPYLPLGTPSLGSLASATHIKSALPPSTPHHTPSQASTHKLSPQGLGLEHNPWLPPLWQAYSYSPLRSGQECSLL